jgi:N-acetylmuramic acid 6-phosphate (MurNAc-6-P) etherase
MAGGLSLGASLGFAAALGGGLLGRRRLHAQRPAFIEAHLGGVNEGDEDAKPVTERRNVLSADMHRVSAAQLCAIARGVDRQIVDSYAEFPRLDSPEKLRLVDKCVAMVAGVLRDHAKAGGDKGALRRIVLSGSGTSGRIGFYVARKYNALLATLGVPAVFSYTHSGGDSALLLSDELPEDDPQAGVADLEHLCGPGRPCLVIGITCGLSAPYCAGQVDLVLDKIEEGEEGYGTILMGFNPPQLARAVTVERWADRPGGRSRTVRDVVSRVCERMRVDDDHATSASSSSSSSFSPRAVLLNPIIGPELVCASSRMKGGSVTLLLLETICTRAILEVYPDQVLLLILRNVLIVDTCECARATL